MTVFWLTLTALLAAATYALGSVGRSEDRADADWAWQVIRITRHNHDRAARKLTTARERPVWLPVRHPGRWVPTRDHAIRRLRVALDEMREAA